MLVTYVSYIMFYKECVAFVFIGHGVNCSHKRSTCYCQHAAADCSADSLCRSGKKTFLLVTCSVLMRGLLQKLNSMQYVMLYPDRMLRNTDGILPLISEKCVNLGLLPPLSVHSGHVHQLGEVEVVSGVSAEESGVQLRRPGELQQLLTATFIRLEAKQTQKDR